MNDLSSTSPVVENIKSAFSGLSNAERLVARSILADYPASCLGPVAAIAKNARVSAPSVVRFAKSLGYASFIEFREAVLAELAQKSKGPLNRARHLNAGGDILCVQEKMETLLSNAMQNLAAIPDAEWDSLSSVLADGSKNIFVAGGRFSTAVARILALNLQLLRSGVILLDDLDQRDKGILLDMNRKSVLVVFDFYRYQKSVIKAAHVAKQKGATVILISDGDISPISADASIVLPVSTTSFLPMSSLSAATAIIEVLLGDVYAKIGKEARDHLAQWELFTGDETLQ